MNIKFCNIKGFFKKAKCIYSAYESLLTSILVRYGSTQMVFCALAVPLSLFAWDGPKKTELQIDRSTKVVTVVLCDLRIENNLPLQNRCRCDATCALLLYRHRRLVFTVPCVQKSTHPQFWINMFCMTNPSSGEEVSSPPSPSTQTHVLINESSVLPDPTLPSTEKPCCIGDKINRVVGGSGRF